MGPTQPPVKWVRGSFPRGSRNCLLKQVIEGKIKGEMQVTRRLGRRRKKLLDVFKDRRGYSQLKEEALDRTMWRNRFGGGFGPVVRQNTEWMNENGRSVALTTYPILASRLKEEYSYTSVPPLDELYRLFLLILLRILFSCENSSVVIWGCGVESTG